MIQFDLPKQKSSIIKVLGVGGGGSNAVNFMFQQDIEGVDFIICNTDSKAIEQSLVPNKIQLGPHLTQGLGAGADPSVGKLATEESLEEIKKILEVNTKMAFITVGMGGGTGTGGAPIIAKICKDLGILTVGIVTTPFGFEGPRRQKQAEDGINQLKPLVDTLLVISNDKLRVQYGNLKMKEAFTKADNVLATAAKCITDVINSRGHIIVDFADVCTVMKNGGVAILGKAEVEGENRAQRAIEEALNSPLLNDNDIKGAKWILLNINSAEGDFECSMDELETISSILRERTGEHSDVIMGSGYDDTLGEKIGITLIATGFEGKDPFKKEEPKKAEAPVEEKIVMTLVTPEAVTQKVAAEPSKDVIASVNDNIEMELEAPEENAAFTIEAAEMMEASLEVIEVSALMPTMHEEVALVSSVYVSTPDFDEEEATASDAQATASDAQATASDAQAEAIPEVFELNMEVESIAIPTTFVLSKPSNIYEQEDGIVLEETIPVSNEIAATYNEPKEVVAEKEAEFIEVNPSISFDFTESVIESAFEAAEAPEMVAEAPAAFESSFRMVSPAAIQEAESEMQLVIREEAPVNTMDSRGNANNSHSSYDMPMDDAEEQRRKVAERIQKLRNLSFNINNGSDPNTEFDAVPAYVRRNLDLFGNTMASVENYYSKYTVEQDENNQTQISTINSFLDGKKPD
jgi:cell division protein FtsZ